MSGTVNVNDYLGNIAQVARKCPTNTLRRAYMRAMREWCQQTQWYRENIPGQTIADQPAYSLGSDPDLDVMGIFAMQASLTLPSPQGIQYWPIVPSNGTYWDPNYQPNPPTFFQYVPEGQFALYPTPDQVYGLLITLILAPKESSVNVPLAPLTKYSNDIEAGALEYLMGLPGMPWTDKAMSVAKGREFRSGISNGKAEAQRSYNVGAQRAKPRQFIV